jgi:hypothetical protein
MSRRCGDGVDRRKLCRANCGAKAGKCLLSPVEIALEVLWAGTFEEVSPKFPGQDLDRSLREADERIGRLVRVVWVYAHYGKRAAQFRLVQVRRANGGPCIEQPLDVLIVLQVLPETKKHRFYEGAQ